MNFEHVPVLIKEVIDILNPQPGEVFVDCTLGKGGHSREILKRIIPDGYLIGIDQDANALRAAKENLADFQDNVIFVHSNYERLDEIIREYIPSGADGILFDLGVSSHQLDEKERGFSYMQDAPLDMRMNRENPFTAKDLVNSYSQEMLAKIIKEYGEERWAQRIAEFIVQARQEKSIETTRRISKNY